MMPNTLLFLFLILAKMPIRIFIRLKRTIENHLRKNNTSGLDHGPL
jgi:hypothetical protein